MQRRRDGSERIPGSWVDDVLQVKIWGKSELWNEFNKYQGHENKSTRSPNIVDLQVFMRSKISTRLG